MKTRTKIILTVLAIIAPFVALKIMGRPIIIETKIKLAAAKETDNCLPLTTTSLMSSPLYIIEPSMGFAISNQGALQQVDRVDLVFTEYPEGRLDLEPGATIKTCLRFRSNEKLTAIRAMFAGLSKDLLMQCKLGVRLGADDLNYKRVYAIVFPCERYLKDFVRNP